MPALPYLTVLASLSRTEKAVLKTLVAFYKKSPREFSRLSALPQAQVMFSTLFPNRSFFIAMVLVIMVAAGGVPINYTPRT